MTTWGIQGAMVFVFFLKKKVDMLEKIYTVMSLFNLHFSYLLLLSKVHKQRI